ncbi:CHASE2 domain-containing protein [Kamptonema cortianum]|uniref:CHASE2 domain-containing protein n=1 Tax=Geitlerinema calcuttense NRMC-F 0142 TaxID=2922238 RepID=A0ABT7LWL8_9CYAN|nr:CHASE2 domain-containing protein [Geitlerinema calcuttense]MDK3159015.1 CHASE2 domain-containing protein [Kamptonema cortianum]MDL5056408.1 CHASE2 domain-containing protein [Geitlerinema calcuttense NRMC-F 0142]
MKLGKKAKRFWASLKHQGGEERRVFFTSFGITGLTILLRFMGLLQASEWTALDQFYTLRPTPPQDERIVIVGIDEADLQTIGTWPIPDAVMADLLTAIASYQPKVIGLDIYRDLPIEPGHAELQEVMGSLPNLIGIEWLADTYWSGVPAPQSLVKDRRVGFNNVVTDPDGTVRRNTLYMHIDGKARTSFALKIAFLYLQHYGITPMPAQSNPQYLQLGEGVFRPFRSNDGGYVRVDDKGYQILADFRGPAETYTRVSMMDVIEGKVEADLLRDRIVLIGSVATRLRDFFRTPYSNGLIVSKKAVSGVELQANFISQILDVALYDRPILQTLPNPLEWLWILVWAYLGASFSWSISSPQRLGLHLFTALLGLTGACYAAFLVGWWLPFVPPAIALSGSAIFIISYLAHQKEELNRSKEFLHKVIDSIPDPVFVKDKNHRWVVLNQAYCNLIGYPLEALLEKSDRDVFSRREAEAFRQHDEETFFTHESQESEESLTDARGVTHLIATKRSLHQDAAGNLFLVGVMRDITQRKRREEELKLSNEELKVSQNQMRYLAYHDNLTRLANRKLFEENLTQAIAEAEANHHWIAILFLDLDGFKDINDTLGHDGGDMLLKAVALRLTGCLRSSDTVARFGGDEFTVILPKIPTIADAARVADKILSTLMQSFSINGQTLSVTTSIGISLYPVDAEKIENLIKCADTAMYRAKDLGKNRYEFWHNLPNASDCDRARLPHPNDSECHSQNQSEL